MPTDLNDRIALAKGWTWSKKRLSFVKGYDGPLSTAPRFNTNWRNPEGKPAKRPDFTGTVQGVDGMMRELNETRAEDVKYYDWSLRWSALFQIWDFYGDDEITEERRVQLQSTKEEGSGIAVGNAYLSVFEKEAADGSE